MSEVKTLYDEDFVLWSKQQAEALRAARTRSNEPIDWENLAEEIEELGASLRRELRSRIRQIIEHLVKLEHSLAIDPRPGWRDSIRHQRAEIENLLVGNKTLSRELAAIIRDQVKPAAHLAIVSLDEHGELAGAKRRQLKSRSYLNLLAYTEKQVLGDWFPPDPRSDEPPRGE